MTCLRCNKDKQVQLMRDCKAALCMDCWAELGDEWLEKDRIEKHEAAIRATIREEIKKIDPNSTITFGTTDDGSWVVYALNVQFHLVRAVEERIYELQEELSPDWEYIFLAAVKTMEITEKYYRSKL